MLCHRRDCIVWTSRTLPIRPRIWNSAKVFILLSIVGAAAPVAMAVSNGPRSRHPNRAPEKARGRSRAEDPKAAAILLGAELARSAKGKIVAVAGYWAATAAIGRNAMQREAGVRNRERCKNARRIQNVRDPCCWNSAERVLTSLQPALPRPFSEGHGAPGKRPNRTTMNTESRARGLPVTTGDPLLGSRAPPINTQLFTRHLQYEANSLERDATQPLFLRLLSDGDDLSGRRKSRHIFQLDTDVSVAGGSHEVF
jgi:hypothetical protein